MSQQFTIGLIGCGLWGNVICDELLALGQNVRVFDPAPQSRSDVEWCQLPDRLPPLKQLSSCDALIMATPASKTPDVLSHVLPLDLPVFVEKPLATGVQQLTELDPKRCRHVKMMHIWRYHPAVEALASIRQENRIGEVLGIRSFRTGWTSPRVDIDSLWNLAVHDLTISKEILGFIPKLTSASAEFHHGTVRGALIALGQSPYHWIEVSNRFERKVRELRLHGTEGVAVWHSDSDPFVRLYLGSDKTKPQDMEVQTIDLSQESAMVRELKAFLGFVAGGEAPKSDYAEGIELVERLSEIQRALENQHVSCD